MALAAVNPNADPILTEALDGTPNAFDTPAPPFSLTDQHGRTVSLASLRGHVVALTFLDPVCTSDCPLIAQEFRQTDQQPRRTAPQRRFRRRRGQPVYRSLAYTSAFDRQEDLTGLSNWYFLTGSVPQLSAAWSSYGVQVRDRPRRGHGGPQRPGRRHRPGRPRTRRSHRRPRAHAELRLLVLVAPLRPDTSNSSLREAAGLAQAAGGRSATGLRRVAPRAVFVSPFASVSPDPSASHTSRPGLPARLPRRPVPRCAARCRAQAGPGSWCRWGSWATRRTPSGNSCMRRRGPRAGLSSLPKAWRTTAASWPACPRSRSMWASCRAACSASRRWPAAPIAAGRGTRPSSPARCAAFPDALAGSPDGGGPALAVVGRSVLSAPRLSRRGRVRRRWRPSVPRGPGAVPRRSTRSRSHPRVGRWPRPTAVGAAGSGSSRTPRERGARAGAGCSGGRLRQSSTEVLRLEPTGSRTRRSCWPPLTAAARSCRSGRSRAAAGPNPARSTLPSGSTVVSTALGGTGTVAVLVSGPRGVVPFTTKPGTRWSRLPAPPRGTIAVAVGNAETADTVGGFDAFTVSGTMLGVYTTTAADSAWARVESIRVPLAYGSSS